MDSSKSSVLPVEKFEGDKPYFPQPCEVGCFSLDIDCKFLDDKSRLRYYTPPDVVNFNLRVGYKDFIQKNAHENDGLNNLLNWIILHPEKFRVEKDATQDNPNDSSLHTDFVTCRGHMTKFLCTPYNEIGPRWQMAVSLFKGTIYMSEVETNVWEPLDETSYGGYKFEDYVTSPANQTSDVRAGSSVINNKEQYITVVHSRIENHSLIYGAEVDCCIKNNETGISPLLNYIELKTSKVIANEKMKWSFERYKLLKWWAQSFLAGVPKIVCGFRNDNGIVEELKSFNTLEIPTIVAENTDMWSKNVCLNFCNQFLNWVKSVVKDEDEVYMLHWRKPFKHVTFELSKDPNDKFLPDWYINPNPNPP